jgi:hypothetical protein
VDYDTLLSTARTRTGRQIHDWADVAGDSVLTIGNVQSTAAILLKSGLLSVNPVTGKFMPKADPTPAELEAKAKAEAAQNAGIITEHLTPEFHGMVEELGERVGSQSGARATMASVISKAVDGDMGSASEALSHRIGDDPSYCATVISNAIANGTKSAAAYISRTFPGVDGAAVIDHASTVGTKSERSSKINRVVLGDKAVFSEMVADYRKQQRREEYSFPRRNG